jgi:predicted CopG family antitoxin
MAVKTITIDLEAYDLLARRKKTGQSFSQVVKTHFRSVPTGRDLAEALDRLALAPGTINAIEAELRERRRHRAKVVGL